MSSLNQSPKVPASAVARSLTIQRALSKFKKPSSVVDELPLLDLPPSTWKQDTDVQILHLETPRDDVYLEHGHLHEGFDSDKGDKCRSFNSLRTWGNNAYRRIRSSGPANTNKASIDDGDSQVPKTLTGWRLGTRVCCSAVVLCIVLEIALLIYASKTSSTTKGSGILMEGNCKEVRELELWLLLPLNIAGTILIGTSNYVMQVLSAVDRKEIDHAHASARSVSVIGVSFGGVTFNKRNRFRRSFWWLLGLSSIPIHFLLNVAVYSSVQASNTGVLVVGDDFDSDSSWDQCDHLAVGATSSQTVACSLHQNYKNNKTRPLSEAQCLRQYSNGFQTNASSVIVVTDRNSSRWYNPPVIVNVPQSADYGSPCRQNITMCKASGSVNCDTSPYYMISDQDRRFNITYDAATQTTNASLDFYPFCHNKTFGKNGVITGFEIDLTSSSSGWSYSTSDELLFREIDPIANIASIKTMFSAFQYRFWATAAISGDYLSKSYSTLLDNRDPRSWLCPYADLESNRMCNALNVQRESEWRITPQSMLVKECHVLPKEELCTLRYSPSILIITICFDVIKLMSMVAVVTKSTKRLMTLGDVIESFLRNPDPYTETRHVLDHNLAKDWALLARNKIRAAAHYYLRARFGGAAYGGYSCPFCGKSFSISTRHLKKDFLSQHGSCGDSYNSTDDPLRLREQCLTWIRERGLWWTFVATEVDARESKILERHRWFHMPSKGRWNCFAWLYALALILATVYFTVNFKSLLAQRLPNAWATGFAAPDPNSMLLGGLSGTKSIYSAAILVNAPQVAFSLLYFIFNGQLTMMHTAHEWAQFSVRRKALRVSSPRGQQRATYWLQLPWSYSIPLIITCGSMHWLLSRSLYIVKVDVYGYLGERQSDKDYFACGYSPIPALLLILVLAAMGFAIVGLALRWLPVGMPWVKLNSLAIAAACHADPAEKNLEFQPLMWGELPEYSGSNGPLYSFSARQVVPLCEKQEIPNLRDISQKVRIPRGLADYHRITKVSEQAQAEGLFAWG